jgi:hypothetical protein
MLLFFSVPMYLSSRMKHILGTPKTHGGVEGPIYGQTLPICHNRAYPTPRNWRHTKFEIHIWSWRPSRRTMTHGKIIPRTPTIKYGPPHRWNLIHHIPPSRAHDDSKRKGVIHIDMCSAIKNDQQVYTRPSFVTLGLFTSRSRWRKHVVTSS